MKKASKQRAGARNSRSAVDVPRPWKCDVCLTIFATRSALACHAKFAHGDRSSVRLAVPTSTCPWCQTDFHTRLPAIRHVELANASECHMVWVIGALPLRDPNDHEVHEANERENEWLFKNAEKLAKIRLLVSRRFHLPTMTCWCVRQKANRKTLGFIRERVVKSVLLDRPSLIFDLHYTITVNYFKLLSLVSSVRSSADTICHNCNTHHQVEHQKNVPTTTVPFSAVTSPCSMCPSPCHCLLVLCSQS